MTTPAFDPENCEINSPPRLVDTPIDCDLPTPPDPITQCPEISAAPLIAGPPGPCPTLTASSSFAFSQLAGATPRLTVGTAKPSANCAWRFDFGLVLPCQDIDVGAQARLYDPELDHIYWVNGYPRVEVTRYRPGQTRPPTMPNSGSVCSNGFMFDFVLPSFCPTVQTSADIDVQYRYTSPQVAIQTVRDGESCDIAFAFGFALPCPDVKINAEVTTQLQLNIPPKVVVNRTQPPPGCTSQFDFNFQLPWTCPDVRFTASTSTLPPTATPTVQVIQTANRQSPSCNFNVDFRFGIPSQDQNQPSTPPVAIAYLQEEFCCCDVGDGASAILYQFVRFAGRLFWGTVKLKPDDPLSTSGYYPAGTYVAVVMDTDHAWLIANKLVPSNFQPSWHVVSAGMHNARAILNETLAPNGEASANLDVSGYPLITVKSRGAVGKRSDYVTVEWDNVNCEWMCNDGGLCVAFPENTISDFYRNFYPTEGNEQYVTGHTPDGQAYWFQEQKAFLFSPTGCDGDVMVIGAGWSIVCGEFDGESDLVVDGRGGQYKISLDDIESESMDATPGDKVCVWFDGYFWRPLAYLKPRTARAGANLFVGELNKAATLVEWDEGSSDYVDLPEGFSEIQVSVPDYFKGYIFQDDVFSVAWNFDRKRYEPVGSGDPFFYGDDADSSISGGASGSLTLPNDKTITVYAIDQIYSGKPFAVWWDNYQKKWYGSGACR